MKIKVFSPATIGNIGPGFDVLGVAIEGLGDIVIAETISQPIIEFISDPNFPSLPTGHTNVVYHVAKLIFDVYKPKHGIRLTLQKNIPLSSGLGGSAASSVAAVFAVNELLGKSFTREQLIPFAVEGERLATGSAHADNVAPALFGGLCLSAADDIVQLPVNDQFYWVVVHPHVEAETRMMREVLPKQITLTDHVAQSSCLSLLLSGLLSGKTEWIRRGLFDRIVEPRRAQYVPGFYAVQKAGMQAGALGVTISGAGPSVFAITSSQKISENVATAMQLAFREAKLESDIFISKTNFTGTTRIE